MNTRDIIRAKTVGAAKKFKSKIVKFEDIEVEVRQPTVTARSAILRAAKAQSGDQDKIDLGSLQVETVLQCCFEPGSNVRVYEDADRESLKEQPAGGFVDTLSEAALELMNVDAKAIEKNSAGTATV